MHAKPDALITEITTHELIDGYSVTILPALSDNYIFLLRDEKLKRTYAIDPSVSDSVLSFCTEKNWRLNAVLLTHHHADHVDGAEALSSHFACPIFGNINDQHRLPQITDPLSPDGDMDLFGLSVNYFATPGHTLGHICYFFSDLKILFCGDTLFSFGCGRLFEGSAEQMISSLGKIRNLPDETLVFCAHEYTKKNLAFALKLEPDSEELHKKYAQAQTHRGNHQPTIPSRLGEEKALSPFLRWDDPALHKALAMEGRSDLDVFKEVRERRNHF